MKKKINPKLYYFMSLTAVASVGILHGYDIISVKLLYFFDSFRILFNLSTWDGSGRNDFGTLLSMINLDDDDNDLNYMETTSGTGLERKYRNLKQTNYEDLIEGIITFGYIFGAIFGAYIISLFTERKGRKKLILISTAIFSIGSFLAAFSFRTGIIPITITLSRFITGMSIGSLSVVCPIFISELAPSNYRGIYIYIYNLFIVIGFILSNVISVFSFYKNNINPSDINKPRPKIDEPINNFHWKILFIIQGMIGLAYLFIVYKIPEPPRWLWFNEENIKAENIFTKLHGRETSDIKLEEEYEIMKENAIYNRSIGYSRYSELWRPNIRRRTLTIFFFNFFQQWTGYIIYNKLGNPIIENGSIFDMILVIPPLMTYPFIIIIIISLMPLVEQYGRKSLLIFNTIIIFIFNCSSIINNLFNTNINKSLVSGPLFLNVDNCSNNKIKNDRPFYYDKETGTNFYSNTCHTGTYYCDQYMNGISWDKTVIARQNYSDIMKNACQNYQLTQESTQMNSNMHYFIGQIGCVIVLSVFLASWEPISYIYQSEIFPIRIRGKGASVGIMSKYINQGLITFIGPRLLLSIGKFGFLPYAICSGIAFLFIYYYCPETKGITLEKIDTKISEEELTYGIRNGILNNLGKNKAKYVIQNDQ